MVLLTEMSFWLLAALPAVTPTSAHDPGVTPKSVDPVRVHSVVSAAVTPLTIVEVQVSATSTELGTPLAENLPGT